MNIFACFHCTNRESKQSLPPHTMASANIIIPQNTVTSQNVLITYPTPATYQTSKDIVVTINGNQVDAIATNNVAVDGRYIHVSMLGVATVVIAQTSGEAVTTYSISPLTAATVINGKLTLQLSVNSTPQYLVIQIGSLPRLILFADPLETNQPTINNTNVLLMKCNPSTDNHMLIQNSINQLSTYPSGGTVYFPPGVCPTSTIQLMSNVNIYLAGGAVLQGYADFNVYPNIGLVGSDAGNTNVPKAVLVNSNNQNNIVITGRGVLDVNGTALGNGSFIASTVLNITDADGIIIEGIISMGARYWSNIITSAYNANINLFKVIATMSQANDDGLDICNSSNVIVSNGFVASGDDAYCVKTMGGNPLVASNITFTNNLILNLGSAYKIGDSVNTDITNIVFENSTIVFTNGLFVQNNYAKNSMIKNIIFNNITIENLNHDPETYIIIHNFRDSSTIDSIYFNNVSFPLMKKYVGLIIGDIKNIFFKNVFGGNAVGYIKNISQGNIKIRNKNNISFDVRNVTIKDPLSDSEP